MFAADTRLAGQAVTAAERRGLPISDEIRNAASMWRVIVDAGHEPFPERPAADGMPTTPEELRARIEQQAEAKRHADSIRAVATSFHEPLASAYNQLVKAAVPGWIASLAPEYTRLVKTIRKMAAKLPTDLRTEHLDWNNPVHAAAWEGAQGAAAQLDQVTHDRQSMARCLGTDGGHDAKLYVVAEFPQPDLDQVMAGHWLSELSPIAQEWKALAGQPVARWVTLARAEAKGVKLVLALPDEVHQRAATVRRWQAGSVQLRESSTLGSARKAVEHAIRPQAA